MIIKSLVLNILKLDRLILTKYGTLLLLLFLAATGLRAQNPTYICELRNDHQVDSRTFDFDIYLLRTGTTTFELLSFQFGININAKARNGGVYSVSLVAKSSQLNALQIPIADKFTFTSAKNSINITAMLGPGVGFGTIISNKGLGTKVGTIRITNSVDFSSVQPNLAWGWLLSNVNVITRVNAYECIGKEITVQSSHTVSHLINAVLNPIATAYDITLSGSYCQGGDGLPVGVANSQVGVTYTLYKDKIVQVPTVTGTGLAISFGNQLAGTYTVSGTYGNGSTVMTGSAVITEKIAPTVPTGLAAQSFCSGALPKLVNLTTTGTGIQWFAALAGGQPLADSTTILNGNHYFASQTVNGCESIVRLDVIASVTTTQAPSGNALQSFCSDVSPSIANINVKGIGIKWYASSSGGSELPGTTALVNNIHYYASQTVSNCESSSRLDVTASIIVTPVPKGIVVQSFCSGELPTVANLTATGTAIQWYDALSGGNALAASTALVNGNHYFASQTVVGCESLASLNVTATFNKTPDAPSGTSVQPFCMVALPTVAGLEAAGKAIQWYDALSDKRALAGSNTLVNGKHYFASQTFDGCESIAKFEVTAIVKTTPQAPTGIATQSFYSGDSTTVACLSATGTSIQWYTVSVGGFTLEPSAALTNATHYFASQTVNGCESEMRLNIVATINPVKSATNDTTILPVVVNPQPETPSAPVITKNDDILISSSNNGNQWFMDGLAIRGATGKNLIALNEGLYYVIVTQSGNSSAPSNSISILPTLKFTASVTLNVYPNPNSGLFNIQIETNSNDVFTIDIYNSVGGLIWNRKEVEVNGIYTTKADLTRFVPGIYTVALRNKATNIVRKVIIMR